MHSYANTCYDVFLFELDNDMCLMQGYNDTWMDAWKKFFFIDTTQGVEILVLG